MTSLRAVLFGVVAAVSFAPVVEAQSADVSRVTAVESVDESRTVEPEARVPAGPTIEGAAVAVRARPSGAPALATVEQQGGGFGRAETLMIVGGAAFVAGLLIGDDAGTIVMVGGAVIGLYGLYLYLQSQ